MKLAQARRISRRPELVGFKLKKFVENSSDAAIAFGLISSYLFVSKVFNPFSFPFAYTRQCTVMLSRVKVVTLLWYSAYTHLVVWFLPDICHITGPGDKGRSVTGLKPLKMIKQNNRARSNLDCSRVFVFSLCKNRFILSCYGSLQVRRRATVWLDKY